MDILQAILLALIQGLTEFLPISSSAHLILLPLFTEWQDQGLGFDVTLNTATWLAVVIYFRGELNGIVRGFFRMVRDGTMDDREGRLALMLIVGTVPVGIAGLLAHDIVAYRLRTPEVIAWSSIVWGVVLWMADRRPGRGGLHDIDWRTALGVGLAQAIALVPGTSRSGITITAGLFLGLSRRDSARFSFLLAVMVGGLAGGMEMVELIKKGGETPWLYLSIGFTVAFVSAYVTIHYFLSLIGRFSMTPFVVYRVLLGVILLYLFWDVTAF